MSIGERTFMENSETNVTPLISAEAVDMSVLKAFEEMHSDEESDLIVELIDLYLEDAPARLKEIRDAVAENDASLLKRATHSLKGSSSSIGVLQVAEICKKLEQMDCQESPRQVEAIAQLLDYKFAKASEELEAERQRRLS